MTAIERRWMAGAAVGGTTLGLSFGDDPWWLANWWPAAAIGAVSFLVTVAVLAAGARALARTTWARSS